MIIRLRKEVQGFLDLLFPPACPLCQANLVTKVEASFCFSCRSTINPLPVGCCSRCAFPFPSINITGHHCESCSRLLPPYLSVHCAGVYDGGLREAVHRFKYEGCHYLDRPLGALLSQAFDPSALSDIIIPVPLHAQRLRERTYNQSLLLARELALRFSLPVRATVLERVRDTPQQQGLRARERAKNLRDAFVCRQPLEGDRILLVDDVMTTGATAAVCSQALLDAGASEVRVAVVARAGRG